MDDLPVLTLDQRIALQQLLRSIAGPIDDAIEIATGHSLSFILLTWDGNGTFQVSNCEKADIGPVMEKLLERWNSQQDALPSKARQH